MSGKNVTMRRHGFEPARLVLGLSLIGIAVVHLVRATGNGDVPLPVLLALLPAALLLAAAVAVSRLLAVRLARRRARASGTAGRSAEPGGR
jgi:peptidoglycan/LPS O-acetylase OafA/YrhL